MSAWPGWRSLADLVRLPSVLTVPGDTLLGASAVEGGPRGERGWMRSLGLAASSGCLYLAGMALNDYADRYVDAVERPQRPLPSGRVEPGFALSLSAALTAAGVGLAGAAGGRGVLRVALPLAGVVWAYDLALKQTVLGPPAMAAARALDVLMGAAGGAQAIPAAGLVGAHTLTVSVVSRREVAGGSRIVPSAALVGFGAVARGVRRVGGPNGRPDARGDRGVVSLVLLGAYLTSVGSACLRAVRDPRPAHLRAVVATGVRALMPLEASMLVAARRPGPAAALMGAWPLAQRLSRTRSIT